MGRELHLQRIQKLTDAFEDAGLYNPDPDLVERIYEDAVFPLAAQHDRLLRMAAAALERVQVATDSSGAAGEAEDILSQVVTLSGEYIPPKEKS